MTPAALLLLIPLAAGDDPLCAALDSVATDATARFAATKPAGAGYRWTPTRTLPSASSCWGVTPDDPTSAVSYGCFFGDPVAQADAERATDALHARLAACFARSKDWTDVGGSDLTRTTSTPFHYEFGHRGDDGETVVGKLYPAEDAKRWRPLLTIKYVHLKRDERYVFEGLGARTGSSTKPTPATPPPTPAPVAAAPDALCLAVERIAADAPNRFHATRPADMNDREDWYAEPDQSLPGTTHADNGAPCWGFYETRQEGRPWIRPGEREYATYFCDFPKTKSEADARAAYDQMRKKLSACLPSFQGDDGHPLWTEVRIDEQKARWRRRTDDDRQTRLDLELHGTGLGADRLFYVDLSISDFR